MNRLKQLRLEAKLSLRNLEKYINVDYSRISKIEKYGENIESKTLEKFLGFFMVNYSYFNGGDGLIYFYDRYNEHYFPLAYYQFKDIIDNAKIDVSIVDNKVRRIISDDDLNEISKSMSLSRKALDKKLKVVRFLKEVEDFTIDELESIKDEIDCMIFYKEKSGK